MKNNHNIFTPDRLFENHEEWAYAALIDPKKQERIKEVMHDFSRSLYSKITAEGENKVCSEFYTAAVRGFTVRMRNIPMVNRPGTERAITFEDVYLSSTSGEIAPILSNSAAINEVEEVIEWFDPNFRKYLYDLGWLCGILSEKDSSREKVIIYQYRDKNW